MLRLAASCALCLVACADNPYVIGRVREDAGTARDDAGVDACAGALVCAGFEEELANAWPDTIVEGMASIESSAAQAHSGMRSLHAMSSGPMSRAVVVRDFPAQEAGELYLRAWLYIPAGATTSIINFMFLGDDVASNEVFEGVDFNLDLGALEVFLPLHEPSRFTSERQVARDRWTCLLTRVSLSHTAGELEATLDGDLALQLEGLDTLPTGGMRQFRAGVDWSSEQAEFFAIYLDDVVLSTQPVGCD
jgi:hypothetical protein